MKMLSMALFLLLAVASAGTGAAPAHVEIRTFAFTPAKIEVAVGTAVVWENFDESPHQLVTRDGTVRSTVLDTGQSYTFRFTRAGTYAYYCTLHPHMQGVIVVR